MSASHHGPLPVQTSSATLGIAAALTLGAMSPGPSFILVARTSLAVSRKDGLAAAAGMGAGGVVFAAGALLGLLAVLTAVPRLYVALKGIGGLYLIYLGYRVWRGAKEGVVIAETGPVRAPSVWRSFLVGLATQLSNPKTAVVYASVFASLLPTQIPRGLSVGLPVMVFAIETGWYVVVAVLLSAPLPRARYLSAKAGIDRTAGSLLMLLGGKLVLMAGE